LKVSCVSKVTYSNYIELILSSDSFNTWRVFRFGDLFICSTVIFFFNLCGGTLGTAATTGLLYQPQMIDDGDCGKIVGIKIGRGTRSTRRKPTPEPLCPPQIPHD
jgi:hypothetical protein